MLYPTAIFNRAFDITPLYLINNNIKALILDVDNTLTGHGSQKLPLEIEKWLSEMNSAGIKMVIVSNNFKKRVEPFAKSINLKFCAFSCKPSPLGLAKATKMLGVKKSEVALVGDQIFTDILGANIYNIKSLLVLPMYGDIKFTIRLKRAMEKPIIKAFLKKGNIINEKGQE